MSQGVDKSTSIFGLRNDLLVFLILPLLLALPFLGPFASAQADLSDVAPWIFFLVFVPFDLFHVYLGFGITAGFRSEFNKRKLFYLGFPLACFAIYYFLNSVNSNAFFHVYAYASLFHFSRQQLGWMRVAQRRGAAFVPREHFIEDLAIYSSTIGFMFYRLSFDESVFWNSPGDLGFFDWLPSKLILFSILTINAIYIGVQLNNWFKHRYFNLTKNLIWFSTLVFWGWAFGMFSQINIFSVALMIFHHAIPFLFLCFLYFQMRTAQGERHFLPGGVAVIFPAIALVALALATTDFFAVSVFELGEEIAWLQPLAATLATTHYAIDTFFWRKKYNPNALDFHSIRVQAPVTVEKAG